MAILPATIPTSEIIDAAMDAADVAYKFGYDDGVAGLDQAPSTLFVPSTPQWHAYNEGYADGSKLYVKRTGKPRKVLVAAPNHRTLTLETIEALTDPFLGAFQGDYKDVRPDYQRDDYIGS